MLRPPAFPSRCCRLRSRSTTWWRTTATRAPATSTPSPSRCASTASTRSSSSTAAPTPGRPNEILADNHTWAAAQQLGWDQIAATFVDVQDEDAARIVVVDNRTSDLAGYDSELLADILEELPDLDGTGYDQGALDRLLDHRSLPDTIDLPSDGAGTGAMAKLEYLQWGYLQWSTTRVQITAAEVETLNRIYEQFLTEARSDLGFGWHLLQEAHYTAEAPTADDEDDDQTAADADAGGTEDEDGDDA